MNRAAYDAFAIAVEAELRRAFPRWQWEVMRYKQLPFGDTSCGPPQWIRVSASVHEMDGVVALRSKHWLVRGQPLADLVFVIAGRIEQERVVVLQERARRARILLAQGSVSR